tara:strand:+ start:1586 stop:1870 length:285 start_codon:yes stop_codon:yes gene_type:complete
VAAPSRHTWASRTACSLLYSRPGYPFAFKLELDRSAGEKQKYVLSGEDEGETNEWRLAIMRYSSAPSAARSRIDEEAAGSALGTPRCRKMSADL